MPVEIKNRNTGAVLHTVEADRLSEANLSGANLVWANLHEAYLRWANLTGADLRGANLTGADLRWADLTGANLFGADLNRADLGRADLTGANLFGADLNRADLSGADLTGATIDADKLSRLLARVTRVSDGYEFFLFALQEGPSKVKAGCRWMTIEEYRAHVAANYVDTDKARETLAILNYCEACTHG